MSVSIALFDLQKLDSISKDIIAQLPSDHVAAEVLDFHAKRSSLEQIITDAAPWFGVKCNAAA